MECPECKEMVEMVDDSGITTDEYSVYLECPECKCRLVGEIKVCDLTHLEPMEI